MYGVVATAANWPIIGEIATLMGMLMNFIFNVLTSIGIESIGITIIFFTIIIFMLMLPITIKQQKSMRMTAITTPEIQAVQKKYHGKRDQASMMKQQEEMKMIHEKYGTSPTGGCLPMLVQMPILFALFPVVQNIPRFVASVGRVYEPLAQQIYNTTGYQSVMEYIANNSPNNLNLSAYDISTVDGIAQSLYRFQDSTWEMLAAQMPSVSSLVDSTQATLINLNTFLGVNISEAPITMLTASFNPFNFGGILLAAMIPVAAGLTQFLSVKLQPQPAAQATGTGGQIASSMKTMVYIMPLFSVFMGFTLPAGLGLYWAISALVRSAQQVVINKQLRKKPIEQVIKENQEKAAKKRAKKGVSASNINQMATKATRNAGEAKNADVYSQAKELSEDNKVNRERNAKYAKPGSLAARANMVNRYNTGASTSYDTTNSSEKDDSNLGKDNADEK